MSRVSWTGLLVVLVLSSAVHGGPEKADDGSLFGGLSSGEPEARKILEGLVGETRKMLEELKRAAREEKARESKIVGAWDDAIGSHMESWNRKIERAQALSRAAIRKELGGARSEEVGGASPGWPSDWKAWGGAQHRFFEELRKSAFAQWIYDVRLRIEGLEDGKQAGPTIIKGFIEQLEEVAEDLQASRERLEEASSRADVQQELRKFTRTWTAVSNLERAVRARQKQVRDFLDRSDTSPESLARGHSDAKKWADECSARPQLDPMCRQAAQFFAGAGALALDDYRKALEEVRKIAAPLLDGTLFSGVRGFEGAGLDITAEVEKYEKLLQLREASLR